MLLYANFSPSLNDGSDARKVSDHLESVTEPISENPIPPDIISRFSTDTAAVLRAAEIGADAVLMAKNVDGIYSADPQKDPTAVRYDDISYKEVLQKELKALDLTATTFCMDNGICCYAFGLKDPDNIYRVVMGEHVGTELHL